jgi:cobalt-zinc-cadmium efflux system membrane fusion protein
VSALDAKAPAVGRGARARTLARSTTAWAQAGTLAGALVAAGCDSGAASGGAHAGAGVSGREDSGVSLRIVAFDPTVLGRLGIRVEAAGISAPAHTVRVSGTLEYDLDHYAEVGALLEGRVASVKARVGDHVSKGQLLATLVVPSIAEAQAGYLTARAAAVAARKNRDREADLLGNQLTTAREAELASSDAAKAQADMGAAEGKLRALRVADPDSDTNIAGAGAYKLSAPIDGVVVDRDAVLGGFLEPNKTAFVVADLSELRASLEIFEGDLPYVLPGAEVRITVDAVPGKVYQGHVALLDPQVGGATRSVRARVAVPNPDGDLRPGFFVRAAIALPPDLLASRLLVPAEAIQPLGGEDVVFVERMPGSYEVRPIRLTKRTGDGPRSQASDVADVAEGLARGENIVVEGAFLLRGEVTRQ